jgi:GT2 family glycosyltransferase
VPRISVVVPIYEVEAYLSECLRSLAAQTVRDLEDCSRRCSNHGEISWGPAVKCRPSSLFAARTSANGA